MIIHKLFLLNVIDFKKQFRVDLADFLWLTQQKANEQKQTTNTEQCAYKGKQIRWMKSFESIDEAQTTTSITNPIQWRVNRNFKRDLYKSGHQYLYVS